VHYPIWNFHISSAAVLAGLTVDGRPLK
jgi:hypothetical protein